MPINARRLALRAMLVVCSALAAASARPAQAMNVAPAGTAAPGPCQETQGQVIGDSLTSTVYGAAVPFDVYLPPCYDLDDMPLPVMYLLHAATLDQTEWQALGAATAADALIAGGAPPFVMVMPGGDYRYDIDYAAFVLNDLLPTTQGRYPVRTDEAGQTLGGISLGGYWALRAAFQNPQVFAAVGGHSPVVDEGRPDDPWALADTLTSTTRLPVMLDVGTYDTLRFRTQALADRLQANGAAVTFWAGAGGHDPAYWGAHMGDYLRGYLQFLAAGTAQPASPAPPRSRRAPTRARAGPLKCC